MAEKAPVHSVVMPWERSKTGKTEDETASSFDKILDSDEEQPEQDEPEEEIESEDEVDSDPDAEESDEVEEDDDAEEEDDEGVDDEGGDEDLHDVTLPGGEKKRVTLKELREGYSRTADYTRKTQELSVKGKALDEETTAVRGQREQYAAYLEQLEGVLKSINEPDQAALDTLRKENPAEYAAVIADQAKRKDDLKAVEAERKRVEDERVEEDKKVLNKRLEGERTKLLEAIPELKDEKKAAGIKKAVADFLKNDFGATDEDLKHVVDHRFFVLAYEASQFRALKKGKSKLREKIKGKKVMKPGSRTTVAAPGKRTRARKELLRRKTKLAQSGSAHDAAAVFEMFL